MLISASCRVASAVSAVSAAERPAHTGSPTNRVRRGRRLSVKAADGRDDPGRIAAQHGHVGERDRLGLPAQGGADQASRRPGTATCACRESRPLL
jgi:hypothetical protein